MGYMDARLIDDAGTTFGSSTNPIYISNSDIDTLANDAHHETLIFPTAVTQTITFTAGATGEFSAWTEIEDSDANVLTDCFTSDGYIASLIIEDVSDADKIYLIEFGYGATPTVVGRSRLQSGTTRKNTTDQPSMRMLKITSGATVYYRLASEVGAATLTGHIRYYLEA